MSLSYTNTPEHLWSWVESNKDRLKPPVCNALMHNQQLKTMIVGGPNVRRDFHTNPTDEWFYQLKGHMVLTIMDGGVLKDVLIKEGEHFLLPPNVPHSPQRFADTIGLVMETERPNGMLDTLTYYCPNCNNINYTDSFVLTNLGQQLVPFITAYYSDESLRQCKNCQHVDQKPTIPVTIPDRFDITDNGVLGHKAPLPVGIQHWAAEDLDSDEKYIGQNLHIKKYHKHYALGDSPSDRNTELADIGEEKGEKFVYALAGETILCLYNSDVYSGQEDRESAQKDQQSTSPCKQVTLKEGECYLLPPMIKHSITTHGRAISCSFDF